MSILIRNWIRGQYIIWVIISKDNCRAFNIYIFLKGTIPGNTNENIDVTIKMARGSHSHCWDL